MITSDRHEYPVIDVLAVDEARDLALFRVEAADLPTRSLGNSVNVRGG